MKFVQVAALLCIMATAVYSAPVAPYTIGDRILEIMGVTPDMSPADIKVNVTEFLNTFKGGLGLVTQLDVAQLQIPVLLTRGIVDEFSSRLDDLSRDQIFIDLQERLQLANQILSNILVDLGVYSTNPQFASLLHQMVDALDTPLTQFQENTKTITDDELRAGIREMLKVLEDRIDMVDGWLGELDVVTVTSMIEGIKQVIDSAILEMPEQDYAASKVNIEIALHSLYSQLRMFL